MSIQSSEKLIREVKKVTQPAKKRSTEYFGFLKSSANQHGMVFGIVDGNFPHWCCGGMKNFGAIAVVLKFWRNGSVNASCTMDGFFQSGTHL